MNAIPAPWGWSFDRSPLRLGPALINVEGRLNRTEGCVCDLSRETWPRDARIAHILRRWVRHDSEGRSGLGFRDMDMTGERERGLPRWCTKCACSTIGQIITTRTRRILRRGHPRTPRAGCTNGPSRPARTSISRQRHQPPAGYSFTCYARNPYTRIHLVFLRQDLAASSATASATAATSAMLIQKYGSKVGGRARISSSTRSRASAGSSLRPRHHPLAPPDGARHPLVGHGGAYLPPFIGTAAGYDHIFWTEKFNDGMQVVLDKHRGRHDVLLGEIPALHEIEGHRAQAPPIRGGLFRRPLDAPDVRESTNATSSLQVRFREPGQQDARRKEIDPRRSTPSSGRLRPFAAFRHAAAPSLHVSRWSPP